MTSPAAASAREVAERFLHAAADPVGRNLADLYADNVVLEMPFALPMYPKVHETSREELRQRFQSGQASRRYEKVDSAEIHDTGTPEKVVIEYALHGKSLVTDKSFSINYIMVVTVKDGQIVHSRDYTDPIAAMTALGAVPQLIASLSAETPQ